MNRRDKLEDIRKNPKQHHHTYNELVICSTVDGRLDLGIATAHQRYASLGTNGGIRCDVTEGACACGAWH